MTLDKINAESTRPGAPGIDESRRDAKKYSGIGWVTTCGTRPGRLRAALSNAPERPTLVDAREHRRHHFWPFGPDLILRRVIVGPRSKGRLKKTLEYDIKRLQLTKARVAYRTFRVVANLRGWRKRRSPELGKQGQSPAMNRFAGAFLIPGQRLLRQTSLLCSGLCAPSTAAINSLWSSSTTWPSAPAAISASPCAAPPTCTPGSTPPAIWCGAPTTVCNSPSSTAQLPLPTRSCCASQAAVTSRSR